MIQQRSGVIVNLSSVAAKEGRLDFAAYGATKAAILNLTWSAALQLAPYGVRVNAICPGPVDTQLWRRFGASRAVALGIDPQEARRRREEQVPLKRFASPEEVAQVALFLASPTAAYLTGTSIDVAGGAHTS
jgi:NAD(P)-dependent dehydrogenase (short-subunit alcohol dehydrogenase family)